MNVGGAQKEDLYSLGRHLKNENERIHVYLIIQS